VKGDNFGILDVLADGRIILKLMLKIEDVRVDLNHLAQDRGKVGLL
jgi:hypothetical protein